MLFDTTFTVFGKLLFSKILCPIAHPERGVHPTRTKTTIQYLYG